MLICLMSFWFLDQLEELQGIEELSSSPVAPSAFLLPNGQTLERGPPGSTPFSREPPWPLRPKALPLCFHVLLELHLPSSWHTALHRARCFRVLSPPRKAGGVCGLYPLAWPPALLGVHSFILYLGTVWVTGHVVLAKADRLPVMTGLV